MTAMPPAIAVTHVSKTYGSGPAAARALVDVSLDVAAGEVLLMMGPSGSGKTTLLHVLAGLISPSTGDVTVGGADLKKLSNDLRTFIRAR